MKKTLSVFIALIIACAGIFSVNISAFAKKTENEPLYKVSSKVYADAYMLINLDDDSFPVIAAKNMNKKKMNWHRQRRK